MVSSHQSQGGTIHQKVFTDWEAEHLLRFSYFSYINRAMMAISMMDILDNTSLDEKIMMQNIFHRRSIQITLCEKLWRGPNY